jgi:hypothetical protein
MVYCPLVMDTPSFAIRICNVARRNRQPGYDRRIELLAEAGLYDSGNQLNVGEIRAVLEADPSLIDDWVEWSADKRYGGPWLIRRDPDGADCSQICAVSADFMLRMSDLHGRTCGVCAEACQRCADDCARVGDGQDPQMKACADACCRCAESCHKMASAA